jgi:CheY-like chemotaxis protein
MAQSARINPATILIVENEALVRLELAHWLSEMGLNTLSADNADAAIELLDTHPEIEFLLTDIRMPGSMDGIRLAQHVRGRWPPVKIIVISGLVDTLQSALPADTAFVAKPFGRESLLRAVARLKPGGRPGSSPRQAA